MPVDWHSVAWEMLWNKVRLLERKCAAQRQEIKRLTKRLSESESDG
jgi:hypothetical protein